MSEGRWWAITGKVAIGRPKSSVRDRGGHGLHRQHENATAVEYSEDHCPDRSLNSFPRTRMTIFRLKQLAWTSLHAAADAMQWNDDRAELIADGVVHIVGVCLGLIAATALIVLTAVYASAFEITVVSVYVAGLLAMLTLSAMYNLWPVSRAKWVLRRFDHSAIYLLIAATYTPFIVALRESYLAIVLLIGVWCAAIAGVVLKLALPGRYDRVAVGLYLALGWSGVLLGDALLRRVPPL